MSLTMDAPAMIAASITDDFLVSMLIGTPNPTTSFITGITRSISSLAVTGTAPGLLDSPPISIMSAPAAIRPWALEIADFTSRYLPPS